jgi:hypothetical protein
MSMRRAARWMVVLVANLVSVATVAGFVAPSASAEGVPIGNLGDTLHVAFDDVVMDVTVHDVLPSPVPPGWGWNGSPRWRAQGGPWRAPVTISVVKSPTPYKLALATTFTGVTPYADAYGSKHTDAPDSLENALRNAPAGSTVNGAVYWDVYRALVTNVILLNAKTGEHLAQWNIWQPGTPLP